MQETLLEAELQRYFQYDSFRTGQAEIISDVMQGKNVIGVLPTGSGKSICYQLPAFLLEGLTIVVSPLISLMLDQERELKAKGLKKVASINSFVDFRERQRIIDNLDQYKLLYVSPEILQQEYLLERLSRVKVSLFVIDEAHCISQWGHEFRPDYLKIAPVISYLQHPRVLALSATATPKVQTDIIQTLKLESVEKRVYPMDRDNLTFVVDKLASNSEKMDTMISYLKQGFGPTLIYFSSRILTEEVSQILSKQLPHLRIAFYHGGMLAEDRVMIQQQFLNNQLDVICCTSAFGMGINKQNIRLVIHYHLPSQMEAYIQEVGRAGRDDQPSLCVLLNTPNDKFIPKRLIENELPSKQELEFVLYKMKSLSVQQLNIPKTDVDAIEYFQISETKWRFLRFHFEKHGMINNEKIIYNQNNWDQFYSYLLEWIDARLLHKLRGLNGMIEWIETEDCLRKKLYASFQANYKPAVFQCCSNCGVELSDWENEIDNDDLVSQEINDWTLKLRTLLIGD
ncbi:RecQ family ATP-dependent DNA helicase [Oceanobacillus sp. CAU 1775]